MFSFQITKGQAIDNIAKKEHQGIFDYKNVIEIKGLIYVKTDTSLVTGKVIRYNRKRKAKKFIFVTKGKPDIMGWTKISDDFVRPKESILGNMVKETVLDPVIRKNKSKQ